MSEEKGDPPERPPPAFRGVTLGERESIPTWKWQGEPVIQQRAVPVVPVAEQKAPPVVAERSMGEAVAIVRELAKGQPFVRVSALIAALEGARD